MEGRAFFVELKTVKPPNQTNRHRIELKGGRCATCRVPVTLWCTQPSKQTQLNTLGSRQPLLPRGRGEGFRSLQPCRAESQQDEGPLSSFSISACSFLFKRVNGKRFPCYFPTPPKSRAIGKFLLKSERVEGVMPKSLIFESSSSLSRACP